MNRPIIACHYWSIVLLLAAAAAHGETVTGCLVAPSGGDVTGAALSAKLATGDVVLACASGIRIEDAVSWNANTLTLKAQGDIAVNGPLQGSGSAGLALAYGQGKPSAGNAGKYDINVPVTLPAGKSFSTQLGSDGTRKAYVVINALGAAGSVTGTDLQGMSANLAGRYALGGDIDATATAGWNNGQGFAPIGNANAAFTGTLEGLGHSIAKLVVNAPNTLYVGLIGQAGGGAEIRNVRLMGGSVRGFHGVGGLVGANSGGTVRNSFSSAQVNGFRYVGGLVGDNGGAIVASRAAGQVLSTGANGGAGYAFGGLAGRNTGRLDTSHSTGVVSGGAVGMADGGGLVGENYAPGSIANSHASGLVSGGAGMGGMNLGGLVGVQGDGSGGAGGSISGSYAAGDVVCSITVNANSCTGIGGLIGAMGGDGNGGNSTSDGGSVSASYASGKVTTNDQWGQAPGGFVGYMNAGTITNGYWNAANGAVAGYQPGGTITGGRGLSLDQMKSASNFSGFAFAATPSAAGWVIVDEDASLNNANGTTGATRPMLISEYARTIFDVHQLQLMLLAPSVSYRLGADVDASATASKAEVWGRGGFVPVGTTAAPFAGGFDGQGRAITGLTVAWPKTSNVGLFGVAASTASIGNVMLTGSVSGNVNVGGLVGWLNGGTVSNAGFNGAVQSAGNAVGGLVGANWGRIGTSYAAGSVTSPGSSVGGLVGINSGAIANAYAVSQVSGGPVNVGGLAGGNFQGGTVANSYAAGAVAGKGPTTGGLVGGNVSTVTGSYWNMATSGQSVSAGGTGLTGSQITTMASFKGWDIGDTGGTANVWRIYEGKTAPLLRAMLKPLSLMPVYDGTARTLNDVADYVASIPGYDKSHVSGTASGLILSGTATAGSYRAGFASASFSSDQQGYDIAVGSRVIAGTGGAAGDVLVSSPLSWRSGTLTFSAQGSVVISAPLTVLGAGGVSIRYGQASAAGAGADYRINAPVNLPTTAAYSTQRGSAGGVRTYTIVNALGAAGSRSRTDLQGIANNPQGNYALGADIDASATGSWSRRAGFQPINGYTGSFDGLGHGVSGLVIARPTVISVGLFGNTGPGAEIRNVSLIGSSVTGKDNVGGLVGYLNGSTVRNSAVAAKVKGLGNAVGGLVGMAIGNGTASIANSRTAGTVAGVNDVGGLVGFASSGTGSGISRVSIDASHAVAGVSGSNQVGGLVGHLLGIGPGIASISNTYATGSVSAVDNAGGLVGQAQISGSGGNATILASYASGRVQASSNNVGGLLGLNNAASVNGSYWNTVTSGQDFSPGGMGLNSNQMTTAASFVGFDFTTQWVIVDSDGTLNNAGSADGATSPLLASEYSTWIRNAHQLQLMAMNPAAIYAQGADVDASGTSGAGDVWSGAGFAPVGGYSAPFSGSFDGQGHAVGNLSIDWSTLGRMGLFGVIGAAATVQNGSLNGGAVKGRGSVGALAGINDGVISNFTSSAAVSSNHGGFIGGLVGSNNGTIAGSQSSGAVSGIGGFGGGLVGMNNGTLSSCAATGKVNVQGGYSGALVGYNNGTIQ